MAIGGVLIKRVDIPNYLTNENLELIEWWNKWKLYGLPYSGGWAEQPAIYIDVIEAIEEERFKIMEKLKVKNGK